MIFLIDMWCLFSLASKYFLLALQSNLLAKNEMLLGVTCLIEYFIIKLFIDDPQFIDLCCVLYVLLSTPLIQI